MPAPKKDGMSSGGNAGNNRMQNGNRSEFRTDAAISNKRFGNERTLQPWVPDSADGFDGSLEKATSSGPWDQFAENEKRFGVKSNYDEKFYTTAIDKSHPQYRERLAAADKKAREIERSAPVTSHVAEERMMDYVAGANTGDENEEDKYSGVRRQDFPPLSSGRDSKYTPPAKRAPSSQSNVKGAPVDPAIISSQIRAPAKKGSTPTPEQGRESANGTHKNGSSAVKADTQNAWEGKTTDDKPTGPKSSSSSFELKTPAVAKGSEKAGVSTRSAAAGNRTISTQVNDGTPSATSTVERDVLKEFKTFATQQRMNAEKARSTKAKADKDVKLAELKNFANNFKLSTPVPTDLVSIIAKDPLKQKEIQAQAIRNAEDMAKVKTDPVTKEPAATAMDTSTKATDQSATNSIDPRGSRAPASSYQTQAGPPGTSNRHNAQRQQQFYQPQQFHQRASLATRLRNVEQQKFSQPPAGSQYAPGTEMRAPPTGPSNNGDVAFNRRLSGVPSHMGAKLNPNSHEFKPSPFAASFNPNGPVSASSSPRASMNHVEPGAAAAAAGGQLIRRKTKAVDVSKCHILSHIKTIKPPQGRNWNENGGLRPAFDTLPTWRQLQDNENPDSTMHLTYKQFFERQPFAGPSITTPNPPHAGPHIAHQQQLPVHPQHGAPAMGSRQPSQMQAMRMDTQQHGHGPQQLYGNDDHRMMHSNSAQSFASPRPGQVPMAYPGVSSPAHMPYNQPVYVGPGAPHMGQYRSFSNNPPYAPSQQGQMGGHMMMQPHFMAGPQGMMGGPQMMYPGGHPQFMPPTGPPQQVPGVNGYHSPGRPAAPMMVHQGSQQGHPMYGMSPNVQYSQPAYGMGQHGVPMSNMRGYNNGGSQHFGTSPQQERQYQQRNGSNNYNKNHQSQGQQQGQQQGPPGPQYTMSATAAPGRSTESSKDEAK